MAQSEKVLPMDIERLDVVKNGKAIVLAKEPHGNAFKYKLKFKYKPADLYIWVWRSSVNYYFVQNILNSRPKGIMGGPTLNSYLNGLVKTA